MAALSTVLRLNDSAYEQSLEAATSVLESQCEESVGTLCATRVLKRAIAKVRAAIHSRFLRAALNAEVVALRVETSRLLEAHKIPERGRGHHVEHRVPDKGHGESVRAAADFGNAAC